MRAQLLALFPPNTHPLILVSDPDGLLADESTLTALTERGFTIIQENDPVLFRHRIEQVQPFHITKPALVITDGSLEDLPYDIWQQGQHFTLALHTFYPNLSYPILRLLTPFQVARLSQVEQPNERFGERRTIQFLLEQVFGFHAIIHSEPAHFILWLEEFHSRLAPFPSSIEQSLLTQLQAISGYKDWPLQQILRDRQAFRDFIQGQWQEYLQRQMGLSIGESAIEYLLHFETNQGLQDALPRLLRNGALAPVQVTTRTSLPVWGVPGILTVDEDPRPRRMAELKNLLQESLAELTSELRWEDWQLIAQQWAEWNVLQNDAGTSNYEEAIPAREITKKLDPAFIEWLKLRYSVLASRKLPVPHHVHHIPHYLNYLREQGTHQKVALLVMDGMSLSDWMLVKRAWQARQTNWQFKESLVLAQIPTITAISRHALISGLRPADFYIPNATKQTETKAWSAFWMREGLSENALSLIAMNLERNDPTPEITNPRLQALCLIERQIDEIMHGSMLGAIGHHANVNLWASQTSTGVNSSKLETIITTLLDQGFTVFISSDHGHCEADGMGKPAEGLMVQSRGRRARLYTDRRAAEHIQSTYADTLLWEEDGLLPKDLFAVLPSGRKAFAEHGEIVITHGGITMDEIVVPFVEINRK